MSLTCAFGFILMTPAERQHERIKGALRLRGTSFADVARHLDVKPTTVTVVSKGLRRSRRIERAIADALGLDLETVWPTRYPPQGQVSPTASKEVS